MAQSTWTFTTKDEFWYDEGAQQNWLTTDKIIHMGASVRLLALSLQTLRLYANSRFFSVHNIILTDYGRMIT